MLDSSITSQPSQASGELADDLSLLGDLSFSYDLGVSVATTLVEGILLQFPITQDLLDSMNIMDTTFRLEASKLDAYTPVLGLDGPQHLDSNALSKSVEVITTTETVPSSESTWEKIKELWERRFTHPQKIKPSYTLAERWYAFLLYYHNNANVSAGWSMHVLPLGRQLPLR
jgi:hypothetical protein